AYPASIPQAFYGDPGRIRQVVNNLLANAIKFTPEGTVLLEVQIETERNEEPLVSIRVVDTGIGIRRKQLDGIFEKFNQADTSDTRKYGGAGLGLAISKNLVELMQGTLSAKSEFGKGSEFTLQIPLQLKEQLAAQTGTEDFSKRRVLIIDENTVHQQNILDQLSYWGIQCAATSSVSEAHTLLADSINQQLPFDAVILNYRMSDGSGIEAARSIRELPGFSELPVILLSSIANLAESSSIHALGHSWQLTKPVRPENLYDSLSHAWNPSNTTTTTAQATQTPASEGMLDEHKNLVLVVDDNPINLKVAQAMLKKLGHLTHAAAGGQEAIALLEREEYDCVLMDCQMPEMDGYEATRTIRAKSGKYADLTIIALTAGAYDADIDRSLAAGMNDHLSKPITLKKLEHTLSKWLLQIDKPLS
ncbi:MAG: response regulator, partial [Oceanococcus sp.]